MPCRSSSSIRSLSCPFPAAPVHTPTAGRRPARLEPNVRVYLLTGGQHSPAGTPSMNGVQQLSNPLESRWAMRKLLADMNRWIADGVEPPPSAYPRIADGT